MLKPGDIVDARFEVLALIGSGGLADVYKVRHMELGSTYALKLLTWRRAKLAERMVLEGRIQAQLKHPNIVSVVDLVRHDGQVGLLMEFVDGDTLEGTLLAGPTPVDVALRLFSGILAAVDAAHSAGVLHRDLKPANILMARSGSTITPKVADFGLAKVVLDTAAGMTKVGMTMGTPGYLAPEQLADASTAGPRADIFALGVILHELLTGRRAYPLEDGLVAVHATANHELASLREVAPHVPYSVADAIAQAVDRDPEARFPTCAAFAKSLLRDHPSLLDQFSSSLGGHQVSLSLQSTSKPDTTDDGSTFSVDEPEESSRRGGVIWAGIAGSGVLVGMALAVALWVFWPGAPVEQPLPPAPAVQVAPTVPAPERDTEAAVDPDTDGDSQAPSSADSTSPHPAAAQPRVNVAPREPEPQRDAQPEPDTEPVPDTEADTEEPPQAVVAPAPSQVIVVTEIEPDTEPAPVSTPQLQGTWSGTAGRQRMSLVLDSTASGAIGGTLTLTLGPTVRSEPVSGTVSSAGAVQFSAGDLRFTGTASGSAMNGSYASNNRGRRFDWNASR